MTLRLGITLSSSGLPIGDGALLHSSKSKNGRKSGNAPGVSKGKVNQSTLDVQARDIIKDLFPAIPMRDLDQVVARAFDLVNSSSLNLSLLCSEHPPYHLPYFLYAIALLLYLLLHSLIIIYPVSPFVHPVPCYRTSRFS